MCVAGKEGRRQATLARTQEVGVPDCACGSWDIVVGADGKREKKREQESKPAKVSVRWGYPSHGCSNSLTMTTDLFIAEGFDGVEAGGFPGGVHTEDNADHRTHHERGDNPEKRKRGGHGQAVAQEQREPGAEDDADDAAHGA